MITAERKWFVAAPEDLTSTRVMLHLGLNKALRHYRELVVPGIAGVWFVRQLSWAVAGLRLAREHKARPALLATAIEALACKMEWSDPDQATSSRVRGKRAFARHENAWSFNELSKPKYYVSQPFRMSTTRALFGLGLAEGTRFNAMTLTEGGSALADAFLNQKRGNYTLRAILSDWIKKENGEPRCSNGDDPALHEFLSPHKPTRGEKKCVHEHLASHQCQWRRALLKAFKDAKEVPKTEDVLQGLDDEQQRLAIETARAFDKLLEAARGVIYSCARHVANGSASGVRAALQSELSDVRTNADFHNAASDTPQCRHADASRFAEEIRSDENSDDDVLRSIVQRDGQILRWQDTGPTQGPLFEAWQRGNTGADAEDDEQPGESSCENKLHQLFELWKDCR